MANIVTYALSTYCVRVKGYNIYTKNKKIYDQIRNGHCFRCNQPLFVSTHNMFTIGDAEDSRDGYHEQLLLHCKDEEDCGIGYLLADDRYIEE
jgi:hypothetical protein